MLLVAREHDRLVHAEGLEPFNRLACLGLCLVGNHQIPLVDTVKRNVNNRAGLPLARPYDSLALHELVVSDADVAFHAFGA